MNKLFCIISGVLVCGLIGIPGSHQDEVHSKGILAPTVAYDHSGATNNVSSGDGLENSNEDYEDNENEGDLSPTEGSHVDPELIRVQPVARPEDKGKSKKKGKGKRKSKSKGEKSGKSVKGKEEKEVTPDPCITTHADYCIHGQCIYNQELDEPTCICLKGYDGERCGIQLLKTGQKEKDWINTDVIQTVLVIIAVALSVISLIAILLIICGPYRNHRKPFIAKCLGESSEKEKLRQENGDVAV
uniref:Amphiregulin n=1 Tax=Lepisosteus oculatus TaxID=7918 RepID=W5N2I2_LEPOC|nr:PREDICTED: amphiregulin [Lepisosteus oculatus]